MRIRVLLSVVPVISLAAVGGCQSPTGDCDPCPSGYYQIIDGRALDADTGVGIAGLRVAFPQYDSLKTAGYDPEIRGADTTGMGGRFSYIFRLWEPRDFCQRLPDFELTIRFDDPHDRYLPETLQVHYCKPNTIAEVERELRHLVIELVRRAEE